MIAVGNMITDEQYGFFIRPWNELTCNGYNNEPGHLTNYDLDQFRSRGYVKTYVIDGMQKLCRENPDKGHTLTVLRSFNGDKPVVHGYVMTEYDKNYEHTVVSVIHDTYRAKSMEVVSQFVSYCNNKTGYSNIKSTSH
jgi:hypothetical protein